MHADKLAQVLLADDLLVQHVGRAPPEDVALEFGHPLIRLDVVAFERSLLGRNNRYVHIASGTQIIENTRLDRLAAQLHGFFLVQIRLPSRLEDRHSRETARTHGHIGQLVGRAVSVDREEVGSRGVDASHDEIRADMALVAKEVLLEHGHACDDTRLAACRQRVQLQLGGDEGGGELGVGGGSGTSAPDVGGDVMELLAVLVGYDGARGCAGVGCNLGTLGEVRLETGSGRRQDWTEEERVLPLHRH